MRVLLLQDRDNLSGNALIEGLIGRDCKVHSVPRSQLSGRLHQIDVDSFDVVLGYGPHNGSTLGFEWLHQRVSPGSPRPVFVWWVVENLPDPRIPDAVTRCLAGLRVTADRWIRHLRGDMGADDRQFTAGPFGAGQRYRIVGELRRLVAAGIVDLVFASGERRCELLRRHGIPAHPLFFGFASNFGSDLNLERDVQVAFLGQPGSRRRQRRLQKVAGGLKQRNIRLALNDGLSGFLEGYGLIRYLNRCQILLNILRGSHDAVFHRFLLAAANKVLIVTEPVTDYGPFVPGEHLVVSSIEEMPGTVERLIRNEDERCKCVEAAYQLATCHLTMDSSVEKLLTACKDLRFQRA